MFVKGLNGQIDFNGSRVLLSRKGIFGFAGYGFAGEKTIPVSSIGSIQLIRNSFFQRGKIVILVRGEEGVMNEVFFLKSQEGSFVELRASLEKAIADRA